MLSTVSHLNADVHQLIVEDVAGHQETLRSTGSHRFYSITRRQWVAASRLRRGEQLSGLGGQVTVLAVRRLPGVQRVYNLTVEGRHVYRVARCGVLVHNNGCGAGGLIESLRKGGTARLTRGKSNALLRLTNEELEVSQIYVQNPDDFLAFADDIRQIAREANAKCIRLKGVGFGFGTEEGKAMKLQDVLHKLGGEFTRVGSDVFGDLWDIVFREL